jgi:hypothetical protein
VRDELFIRENAALTNLDGLSSLTSVGGDLYIYGNDALCQDFVDALIAACTIGGTIMDISHNGSCP